VMKEVLSQVNKSREQAWHQMTRSCRRVSFFLSNKE
jgi:hypothetical protein